MRALPAALLSIAMLTLAPAHAAPEAVAPWQLRQRDEASGTEVWLRTRGSDTSEFRAVTRVRSRLSALTALLLDTGNMSAWVYRTRQATTFETQGPQQGVSQVIVSMPWPLQDREALVAWTLVQDDAAGGAVTLTGHGEPDKLPPDERYVRMPAFESQWRFTPLPGGEVEVSFQGHGDPGGSLAHPLLRAFVNAAVWEAPLKTMLALRREVVRPEYRDAVLPFIREPAP